MTENESEGVRALFRGADLEEVPVSRDLVGPAVAWGNGRRRRDRWTAVGVSGAVAAVAVAGFVAVRPGGDGGPEAVAPGRAVPTQSTAKPTPAPALPTLSGSYSQREQELLSALQPYLPAGDRITCQNANRDDGFCTMMTVTTPTGTSLAQWSSGLYDYQAAPVDTKYTHPHKATAAIPLVSGAVQVPGGTVKVTSTDTEAQDNVGDKSVLTDPTALAFHTAVYEFTPAGGTAKPVSMEVFELVREMPWKPGHEMADSHALWGFNKTGPVLSPQQFATLVTAPIFQPVLDQMLAVELKASEDQQNQQQTQPSSPR